MGLPFGKSYQPDTMIWTLAWLFSCMKPGMSSDIPGFFLEAYKIDVCNQHNLLNKH